MGVSHDSSHASWGWMRKKTYRHGNQNTVNPRGRREPEPHGAQHPRRLRKQHADTPEEPGVYEPPVVVHCASAAVVMAFAALV